MPAGDPFETVGAACAAGGAALGREGVPAGYREVLYWRIGDKRWQVIIINLVALLSLALWLLLFGWLGLSVGRLPQSGEIGLPQFVLVLAGGLLTLVLHELGHGLAMSAFGAHARFGVLWTRLMVYATAPGHAFPRSAYIVVGLTPLVSLSLLALLGMILLAGTPWVTLLVFCAAANAAGASGDLWILSVVLRYPPSARLIDERDGVRILLPV
jgi:Putative zincin peptidase